MSGNSIPTGDPVVQRIAQRNLARRASNYADEVRRLLDAGLDVMCRAGTTSSPRVADIVVAAGLSNEAFYRHFSSKEALVAAILEDGAHRLASYLDHQMAKERTARAKLRRWVVGIMSQAADAEIAASTLAVLWNGGHVGDRVREGSGTHDTVLSQLLIEPLGELGSRDPERDAAVMTHAVMGRMEEFLWRRARPSAKDIEHVCSFCLAGITAQS